MERRPTSWFSPNLQMEMPLVAYGHAGQALLMLPTAAADYLEYERFYLVDSTSHRRGADSCLFSQQRQSLEFAERGDAAEIESGIADALRSLHHR